MAMDKKHGPKGASGQGVQATPGKEAEADSGQAGSGIPGPRVYTNERGEVCLGTKCFNMAINPEQREIRINIKRGGDCGENLGIAVEAAREVLGKGARTVFEIESPEWKEDKPK